MEIFGSIMKIFREIGHVKRNDKAVLVPLQILQRAASRMVEKSAGEEDLQLSLL